MWLAANGYRLPTLRYAGRFYPPPMSGVPGSGSLASKIPTWKPFLAAIETITSSKASSKIFQSFRFFLAKAPTNRQNRHIFLFKGFRVHHGGSIWRSLWRTWRTLHVPVCFVWRRLVTSELENGKRCHLWRDISTGNIYFSSGKDSRTYVWQSESKFWESSKHGLSKRLKAFFFKKNFWLCCLLNLQVYFLPAPFFLAVFFLVDFFFFIYDPYISLTLWSKYMAQSPKGRLVHGLYNPRHGDCAIYFSPVVGHCFASKI